MTTRANNFFKRLIFKKLSSLSQGSLTINESNRSYHFGDTASPTYTLTINNPNTYQLIALQGSVGAGEAYINHWWDSNDLTGLLRLFVKNRSLLNKIDSGFTIISQLFYKIYHHLNKNSLSGSKRNIAAHYDLGNDFFKLFLDERLMYSSAIFPTSTSSLEEASEYKLKVICDKLALSPDDNVLEIGSGWGGFAIYAAQHYSCKITTITLSQAQYDYLSTKIKALNLEKNITVLLKDYRLMEGSFNKIVSIEMLEAVGHKYYSVFFKKCCDLLRPSGKMLLQTITIKDQYYKQALKSVDYIQAYIFPGSCIPSITALMNAIAKSSHLQVYQIDDIGEHYAKTLCLWHSRFDQNKEAILKMNFSESFCRMWAFYLKYCEAGFIEKSISDIQILLRKD